MLTVFPLGDAKILSKNTMTSIKINKNNSMTYRLKPVDCCGRERPLRLKSSKLFG